MKYNLLSATILTSTLMLSTFCNGVESSQKNKHWHVGGGLYAIVLD
ncbi:MAG: hypothetical protein ACSHW0_09090 [Thalassotalea sp.]